MLLHLLLLMIHIAVVPPAPPVREGINSSRILQMSESVEVKAHKKQSQQTGSHVGQQRSQRTVSATDVNLR